MFLDIKSSTTLAETLGGQKYFSLLNTFFRDISEPILEREAEIYKYVGDEVILTWSVEMGFRDASCIRVFFDILAEEMWPNHSLGRPIAGYTETVKNFKRENLIDFINRFYNPSNISIIVAGKIDKKKIISFTKKTFYTPSEKHRLRYDPIRKVHKGRRIKLFHKNTKQTHIAFGFHSINRTHELRYAQALLHVILGGNMSSRLFERLREQKALC